MKKRIFALGFFDGVHLGHQALLRQCVTMAKESGCEAAAVTFERHPRSLFSETPPQLISTLADRKRLMESYGIEYIQVIPVTVESLSTSWQSFLEQLAEEGAAGFVCGGDFHFGHRGQGNSALLKNFCRERDIPCVIVPEQTLNGVRISSTYIRRQIQLGDMETAVRFLGHPYLLTGTVVPGKQLGRTLGIPTANLSYPEGLAMPRFGVYACKAWVEGAVYPAVTNIGTRPTVEGENITVEPWILDYSGDLYGKQITLGFYRFLRPEQKFDSLEALKAAILQDAEQTRTLLTQ